MALEQVAEALPEAIELVCASLPADFPADIRDSVANGALQRVKLIAPA
jgi:hypothetical protein